MSRNESPLHVFYDGDCGLCSTAVAWALARDRDHRLRPIPASDPQALTMLGPAHVGVLNSLHAWSADGGLVTGPEAVGAVLTRLPGWRWAALLLRAPGVRSAARPAYRWIASHRDWFGTPRCPLPPSDARSRER